ncbi:MAG TPA: serine protein kinase RIO [archaeon]|nr:serine protein kinase RIO [archaeon]
MDEYYTNKKNNEEEDRPIKEEKLIQDEHTREIFAQVFDKATLNIVYEIARRKYFEEIEFVISTGKEGNVFRCKSGNGFYAMKIYKIETSNFKHMMEYIEGDQRFKSVRKDKLEIVKAWTKKEYRNLEDLTKIKVRVPLPITFNRNCLLMEFIGINGEAAPRAKEKPFLNMNEAYETICEYLAKMIKAKLIHADLSEYNILNNNEELVIIDVGQMVTTEHPKAKEFYTRDITNLSKWFSKNGVDTNYEKMYEYVKEKTKKEEKK